MEEIYNYLEMHGIQHKRFDHEAVYTVEEADTHMSYIGGISAKTLLVYGEKSGDRYLISLEGHKKLEQSRIKALLGERVRFASSEDLEQILRVTPGSVSPLGLIFDTDKKIVRYVLDKDIIQAEEVSWHPNANTQTLLMSHQHMHKFLESIDHQVVEY